MHIHSIVYICIQYTLYEYIYATLSLLGRLGLPNVPLVDAVLCVALCMAQSVAEAAVEAASAFRDALISAYIYTVNIVNN